MQHKVPLHPTALTKWRQRVGAKKLVELLAETIAAAQRDGHTTKQDLEQVNVDTTVMEKPPRRYAGASAPMIQPIFAWSNRADLRMENHTPDGFKAVPQSDHQAG